MIHTRERGITTRDIKQSDTTKITHSLTLDLKSDIVCACSVVSNEETKTITENQAAENEVDICKKNKHETKMKCRIF